MIDTILGGKEVAPAVDGELLDIITAPQSIEKGGSTQAVVPHCSTSGEGSKLFITRIQTVSASEYN